MKKIGLVLGFVILNLFQNLSFGQTGSWLWARQSTYEGRSTRYNNTATDKQGNVYITGSYDTTITFGSYTFSHPSGMYIYLVKYSSTGTLLWARSAGGGNVDFVYSIATDTSGNVIIAGAYTSSSITFGSFTLSHSGVNRCDMYIAKYSPTGIALWANTCTGTGVTGGTYFSEAHAVATDLAGNVIVTGWFQYPRIFFGSDSLINTYSGVISCQDIFTVKYSSTGSVIWARCGDGFGSTYNCSNAITTDASGDIYLTGTFQYPIITFGSDTLTTGGYLNMFIAKYSSTGNILWAKNCGEGLAGESFGLCIAVDTARNAYVVGTYDGSNVSFDSDTLYILGASQFAFIVKYNSSGSVVTTKKIQGGVNCVATSPLWNSTLSEIYISGCALDTLIVGTDTVLSTSTKVDASGGYLVKINSALNIVCGTLIDFEGFSDGSNIDGSNEKQRCVALDGFGNAYITSIFNTWGSGTPYILGTDSLMSNTGNNMGDVYLAKYNCNGSHESVTEITNEENITLYPNPTTTTFTIRAAEKIKEVTIYNVLGCEILKQVQNDKSATIDISSVAKGIYFAEIKTEKGVVMRKVVKE